MSIESTPQAVSWSEADPFRVGKNGDDSYEDIHRAFEAWQKRHGYTTQKFNKPRFGSQAGGQG